jgi:hypothetical protein
MPLTEPTPPPAAPLRRRFAAWPLTATLAGLLGATATLVFDTRAGDTADPDLFLTAADVAVLDNTMFRIGGFVGFLCVGALLAAAATWHRRVSLRWGWSQGAPVVTFGLVAAAAALTLAYGWKGALGNYLDGGADENYYDATGLYVYYMLNDFGPFFGWLPVLFSLAGVAWMALVEGLVSKVLGGFLAGLVALVLVAVLLTGVPGLPFAAIIGLVVTGVWLSVGRSPIVEEAL